MPRACADGRRGYRPSAALVALVAAAAVMGTTACASPGSGPGGARRSNVLTAEEIATSPARDALEAVRQLRPTWLRTHGSQSIGDTTPPVPMVYLNHQQYGVADTLRDFRAEQIRELRYLGPSEATTLYGTGHRGGVIEVVLR